MCFKSGMQAKKASIAQRPARIEVHLFCIRIAGPSTRSRCPLASTVEPPTRGPVGIPCAALDVMRSILANGHVPAPSAARHFMSPLSPRSGFTVRGGARRRGSIPPADHGGLCLLPPVNTSSPALNVATVASVFIQRWPAPAFVRESTTQPGNDSSTLKRPVLGLSAPTLRTLCHCHDPVAKRGGLVIFTLSAGGSTRSRMEVLSKANVLAASSTASIAKRRLAIGPVGTWTRSITLRALNWPRRVCLGYGAVNPTPVPSAGLQSIWHPAAQHVTASFSVVPNIGASGGKRTRAAAIPSVSLYGVRCAVRSANVGGVSSLGLSIGRR